MVDEAPAAVVTGVPEEDPSGNPVLVAVDADEMMPFSVDPGTGLVQAPGHDMSLLNMLARWTKMLPAQAPFPPPPGIIQTKITEAFANAKDQGNALFRKQDYKGAINAYTTSLAIASSRPLWEASQVVQEEISVALANRSAAYAAAGAFIEALCDADAVTKIRRPWGKGHFRKGKALVGLARFEEARAAYELGHQFEPDNEEFVKAIAELKE
ncbi:hypothetical protein MSPP1_003542 [Malassezia sp. CBS 17886]|nr:hypothetical protein MSPP1_003542 [Malassezia sp. CBS 17886]